MQIPCGCLHTQAPEHRHPKIMTTFQAPPPPQEGSSPPFMESHISLHHGVILARPATQILLQLCCKFLLLLHKLLIQQAPRLPLTWLQWALPTKKSVCAYLVNLSDHIHLVTVLCDLCLGFWLWSLGRWGLCLSDQLGPSPNNDFTEAYSTINPFIRISPSTDK